MIQGPNEQTNRRTEPETPASYHVMWSESGEVMLFLRLRTEMGSVHGESYEQNRGWVDDPRAFDVYMNGQDYELLDEVEADKLVQDIDAGRA